MFWFNPAVEFLTLSSEWQVRCEAVESRGATEGREERAKRQSSHQRRSDYLSGREPGTRQDKLLPATTPGGREGGGGLCGLDKDSKQLLTTFFNVRKNSPERGSLDA